MWVLTIFFFSGANMDIDKYPDKKKCMMAGQMLYASGRDVADFKCVYKRK